jgi:hypothetical protein
MSPHPELRFRVGSLFTKRPWVNQQANEQGAKDYGATERRSGASTFSNRNPFSL